MTAGLLASLLLLALACFYDHARLGHPLFETGPPDLSAEFWIRHLMVWASSLLLVGSLWNHRPLPPSQCTMPAGFARAVPALWCVAAAVLATFLLSPSGFEIHSREAGLAEILSVVCLVAGMLVCFRALGRRQRWSSRWWSLLVLGLLCGFLAGEEISWTSIIFHFELPAFFMEHNGQQELNLHNFFTSHSERLYLSASWFLFLLAPFVFDRVELADHPLRSYLPSREVAFCVVYQFALVFTDWQILFYPWALGFGVVMLCGYAWADPPSRRTLLAVVGLLVVMQAAMLAFPDHHLKSHRVREYREAFIALGFFLYAVELSHRKGAEKT